jgi:hypothetical protein
MTSRSSPALDFWSHTVHLYTRFFLEFVTAQVFSQSLRQVIDFVHCGVEHHASFTKQSLSSTLEKSLAVTTTWDAFGAC